MIAPKAGRVQAHESSVETPRRFGPWPWYLSAADAVGLDVDLVDDIAGDLVEECAGATAPSIVKHAWCSGQILRAVPHLVSSTLRRGQRRARVRLLGTLGVLLLVATSIVAIPRLRVGPPARITADHGFDANDIVINNVDFVQMPLRVLDRYGHTVTKIGMRYAQVSGDPIDLARNGAISCRQRGDAVVRAEANDVSSLVTVHCRPVTGIHTAEWRHDFLAGDPPQRLHVEALGADGQVVKELRGSVRVVDTSVMALHRDLIVPRGPGSSRIAVAVGDARLDVIVAVHELVDRFDNLTPAQRTVAMPMRLALGDTLHLAVPAGTMWVKWMSRDGTTSHPAITAEGPGWCHMDSEAFIRWLPKGQYGAYCQVSEGARIRVASGDPRAPSLSGALLLERMR